MAVTITKLANATTLNRIAYRITADGVGNADLANATMVTDAGTTTPLARLIANTVCDDAGEALATALFMGNSQIRTQINVFDWPNSVDTGQWKITFLDNGAGNRAKMNAAAAVKTGAKRPIIIDRRTPMRASDGCHSRRW